MIDLKAAQKRVYENKVQKGFNISDINLEFCYAYTELSEAFNAYLTKKDDLDEELADVSIYLLGIAEILGIDLEQEILKKISKNEKRQYIKQPDGSVVKIEPLE